MDVRDHLSPVDLGAASLKVSIIVVTPWERVLAARDEVGAGPANNDRVVEVDDESAHYGRDTSTCEALMDVPEHGHVTALELLSKAQLHQCKRDAEEEEGNEVGNDEGAEATVFEGEAWESPEVTEANGETDRREDEGPAA